MNTDKTPPTGFQPRLDIGAPGEAPYDVQQMGERTLRAHQRDLQGKLAQIKAEIGFIVSGVVRHERDKVSADEPIEVIASAVGVPIDQMWRILSGNIRPTDAQRITRILSLCHVAQASHHLLTAERLLARLHALDEELTFVHNRLRGYSEERSRALSRVTGTAHTGVVHSSKAPGQTVAGDEEQAATSVPVKSRARKVTVPPVPDVEGHETKPNPLKALNEAEFVAMMKDLHIWAGNPSLREMEERCGKKLSYSSFRNILRSSTMPVRVETLEVFVGALCGTVTDQQRWVSAWRHIKLANNKPVPAKPPVPLSFEKSGIPWKNIDSFEEIHNIDDVKGGPQDESKVYRLRAG